MSDFTHCPVQKSNFEQIDHVTLYKREKWANPSRHSLKRAMWVICSWLLEQSALRSFAQNCSFNAWPWVICSRRSLQKSNLERISHVTLYKRAAWANHSCRSLKKSNVSDLIVIQANLLQKTSDSLENSFFSYVLTIFHLFYAQEQISHRSLLICSF